MEERLQQSPGIKELALSCRDRLKSRHVLHQDLRGHLLSLSDPLPYCLLSYASQSHAVFKIYKTRHEGTYL